MTSHSFAHFLAQSHLGASFLENWGIKLPPEEEEQPVAMGNSGLSGSNVYGAKRCNPIFQWNPVLPAKPKARKATTRDDLLAIEKRIIDYLDVNSLHTLTRVSRSHQDYFWRYYLVRLLENSYEFDASHLPPISLPYIPENYLSKQIRADRMQTMPKLALGIAERLRNIRPQDMGCRTFMKGSFEIVNTQTIIHYYLMRCVTELDGAHPIQSVIALFKCPSGIFALDTRNTAIESYHSKSPVRLQYINALLQDLILKKEGGHGFEVKPTEESLGAFMKPSRVKLWRPTQKEAIPYMWRIASMRPGVTRDETAYRYDIIVIRAVLTAAACFALLALLDHRRPANRQKISAAAMGILFCLSEVVRARNYLNNRAVELFINSRFPSAALLHRIGKYTHLLKSLGERLRSDPGALHRVSEEGAPLLAYTENEADRRLLMDFGASPLDPAHGEYPLLAAVRKNDLDAITTYLSYRNTGSMTPDQEAQIAMVASQDALRLIRNLKPDFNLDAKTEINGTTTTAIVELFKRALSTPIRSEKDRHSVQDLFQRVDLLSQLGASSAQVEAGIQAMERIRTTENYEEVLDLSKLFGIPSDIAWRNAHTLEDVLSSLKKKMS